MVNKLTCDICNVILLPPTATGIWPARCPFDDFEYSYDVDAKKPIEKLYYAVFEKREYCVEVDLVTSKVILRITKDINNADNEDAVLIEKDFDIKAKADYSLFKALMAEVDFDVLNKNTTYKVDIPVYIGGVGITRVVK
jgi:hypothetical protein